MRGNKGHFLMIQQATAAKNKNIQKIWKAHIFQVKEQFRLHINKDHLFINKT